MRLFLITMRDNSGSNYAGVAIAPSPREAMFAFMNDEGLEASDFEDQQGATELDSSGIDLGTASRVLSGTMHFPIRPARGEDE